MTSSLISFIWTFSRRDQFVLIAATSLLFPLLYLTLELPKRIINDAISAETDIVTFYGVTFPQKTLLVILCLAFLTAVLVHGLLKMRVNTMKGVLAERLLRRFRYSLISRILHFPAAYRAKTSEGELVSMVTAETEPLGGIMGDAFAQPLLQAGQMLTILLFLFLQSFWFGVAACAMIPLQAWIIPRLQKQINLLNRSRIKQVRALAADIGEVSSGVTILRRHGGWRLRMAQTSDRLFHLFETRFKIYKRKFFMKFLNNFLNQLTPFMLFLVGGLLVIDGQLTVGALVAALSAFKDLAAPWKELLTFYTAAVEMSQRYTLVVERFSPPGLLPEITDEGARPAIETSAALKFEGLSVTDIDGSQVLDGVDLDLPAGAWVSVSVESQEHAAGLIALLMRDVTPDKGRILLGGRDIDGQAPRALAQQIGHVTSRPYIFQGTVGENISMPLRIRPTADLLPETRGEAMRTGNSLDPTEATWLPADTDQTVDHSWMPLVMGIGAHHALLTRVLDRSMNLVATVERDGAMATLRDEMRAAASKPQETLPHFAPDTYSDGLTLAENLLFAASPDKVWLSDETMLKLMDILRELALFDTIIAQSAELAATLVEAFDVAAADSPVFKQLGIPGAVLKRLHRLKDRQHGRFRPHGLDPKNEILMISLALNVPSARFERAFRQATKDMVLKARAKITPAMRAGLEDTFAPLEDQRWHPHLSILDNLIFGKSDQLPRVRLDALKNEVTHLVGERFGPDVLAELISALPTELRGGNLSPRMVEVVSLAQTVVKAPSLIVLDHAMASFEPAARQTVFERLRAHMPDATILQIETEPLETGLATMQLVLRNGQLNAIGTEADLSPRSAHEASELQRKLDTLRKAPLFSGLSQQQLRMLAFSARWIDYEAGDLVFRQNDAPDGAYLIYEGNVRLTAWADDGSEAFSVEPEQGALVGELGLIQNEPRRLDMKATTTATLLRIDSADFLSILENDAETAFKLIHVLIGYLDRN